jgi:hypothetical protein
LGVELEVDDGGENSANAKAVLEVANESGDHLYIKHDGSLNEGFELVSHPMALDFHSHSMPWQKVLAKLKELGYHSHQTATAGLHVHVNRDSLGYTYQEQEETIARILFFMEKHWNELLKFSRRTPSQLERWAARYGYRDTPQELLKTAKGETGVIKVFGSFHPLQADGGGDEVVHSPVFAVFILMKKFPLSGEDQMHGCTGILTVGGDVGGGGGDVLHQLFRLGENTLVDFLQDIAQTGVTGDKIGFVDVSVAVAAVLAGIAFYLKFCD